MIRENVTENAGKTVRRLPVGVLPENGFVILREAERGEKGLALAERIVDEVCRKSTYNVFTVTPRWLKELDHPDSEEMVRRLAPVAHRHGVKFLVESASRNSWTCPMTPSTVFFHSSFFSSAIVFLL